MPDPLTDEELAAIEVRAAVAAMDDGPWKVSPDDSDGETCYVIHSDHVEVAVVPAFRDAEATAAFIAAARTDVPRLASELRETRRVLAAFVVAAVQCETEGCSAPATHLHAERWLRCDAHGSPGYPDDEVAIAVPLREALALLERMGSKP